MIIMRELFSKEFIRRVADNKEKILLFCLLFVFIALMFSQKITLVTADLGRHIVNGKLTLTEGTILKTNNYSYTEPDFETVNHHWGSGVIFYLIWKLFDFYGISIFYTVINVSAFLLVFLVAKRRSTLLPLFFFSVLAIPMIAYRTEIRPEGFSYLFLAAYFFILDTYRSKHIPRFVFILLPILQILWVNLHIYFILGIGLALTFGVECLKKKNRAYLKERLILVGLLIISSLCNPFFIKGLIEPFLIFQEYGYRVYENQSILFLQRRFGEQIFLHVEVLSVVVVIVILMLYFRKKLSQLYPETILVILFAVLSWKLVRSIPLFGLVFIPFSTKAFSILIKNTKMITYTYIRYSMISFSLFILFIGLITTKHYYTPFNGKFGWGLVDNVQDSGQFFKNNNLKGPILNNYDIGGYLIYHLYPTERVFVDNRPEAYSISFFQDTYIPMQENDETWKIFDKQYNFNAIFFERRDLTPWAQTFLVNRVDDSKWAPVYVDAYTIIFLKRNRKNKPVIKEFELPRELFQIIINE